MSLITGIGIRLDSDSGSAVGAEAGLDQHFIPDRLISGFASSKEGFPSPHVCPISLFPIIGGSGQVTVVVEPKLGRSLFSAEMTLGDGPAAMIGFSGEPFNGLSVDLV